MSDKLVKRNLIKLLIGVAFAFEIAGGAIALTDKINYEKLLKSVVKEVGYLATGTALGLGTLYAARKLDKKYKTYEFERWE